MTPTAGDTDDRPEQSPGESRDEWLDRFPIGASITVEDLTITPYDAIARLRTAEPVSWIPALGAWFITRRDLAVAAMRDATTFTVDDPRFSTAAVLGPSMLSVDGADHDRHRAGFSDSFRPAVVRERFEASLDTVAHQLVRDIAPRGHGELRTSLAGPLAVDTIIRFLALDHLDPGTVLNWYGSISDAILDVALGRPRSARGHDAVAEIHRAVQAGVSNGSSPLLSRLASDGVLTPAELSSNAAVVMFGAIETSEGMTANVLWHLLHHPDVLDRVRADRTLVAAAIEESLRLEPAAAVVDRYTTQPVEIGGATIPERSMVTISLLGANRDPAVFDDPDRYDIDRPNANKQVAFVQGSHGCIGVHLARLETVAAVNAVLDLLPGIALDPDASTAPAGLIFRKPAVVAARWPVADHPT